MASFYEFFSGGGMARLGLGEHWDCLFSNDICPKKVSAYEANFGEGEVCQSDIYNLTVDDLPGKAELVWGSFPCQDLSLAGNGAGLSGSRSGTFNKLMALVSDLKSKGKKPKVVVLENVVGAITSHQGKDFRCIVSELVDLGYYVGCMVIDGALFVPQSRPRLFIVATNMPKSRMGKLVSSEPNVWQTPNLVSAFEQLPDQHKKKWVWWNLPAPEQRTSSLTDIIEDAPSDVALYDEVKVNRLLGMMSQINLEKVASAKKHQQLVAGGLYKRVRVQKDGTRLQRAEVRFDGVAGCLRTPTGGSSRQTLMLVDGDNISARLLSGREAARLMGVPDNYVIPQKYNEAYHVFGDGLVVPVVSWLEQHLLSKLVS